VKFKNPSNDYIEEVPTLAWLWVLLFGAIYFAIRGIWTHAVAGIILAIVTYGISWLIYPFFAKNIIATNYLKKGWVIEEL